MKEDLTIIDCKWAPSKGGMEFELIKRVDKGIFIAICEVTNIKVVDGKKRNKHKQFSVGL